MTARDDETQDEAARKTDEPPEVQTDDEEGAGPIAEPGSGGSAYDNAGNLGKA